MKFLKNFKKEKYRTILFWHKSLGISVAIFLTTAILLIIFNLKEKEMIKNKKGILWAIPIELLGLTYFIFNNILLQILNIPVILLLTIIMCMTITEGEISENKFIRNVLNKTFKPFLIGINSIKKLQIKDTLKEKMEKENQNEKIEFAKKISKSILISIPLVLIIVILLSSADSVFGNLFKYMTDRMYLYEQEYGYTYLRLFVYFIILNFINIDALIVRNNISKYCKDLENNVLDTTYITVATKTDSIKEKIKILDQSDEGLSDEAKRHLKQAKETIKANLRAYNILYGKNYEHGLSEWNLSKDRVKKLLEQVDLTADTTNIVPDYLMEIDN